MTDKNLLVITPHRKEPGKQRIAAYCRVSSRSDEQLNSLANQIDFYRSRFENDDTVLFVGIYADAPVIIGLKTLRLKKYWKGSAKVLSSKI